MSVSEEDILHAFIAAENILNKGKWTFTHSMNLLLLAEVWRYESDINGKLIGYMNVPEGWYRLDIIRFALLHPMSLERFQAYNTNPLEDITTIELRVLRREYNHHVCLRAGVFTDKELLLTGKFTPIEPTVESFQTALLEEQTVFRTALHDKFGQPLP